MACLIGMEIISDSVVIFQGGDELCEVDLFDVDEEVGPCLFQLLCPAR